MGRGCIYYIVKDADLDVDVSFGAENYYEKLDTLMIDYVEDETKEESEPLLKTLREMMENLGAVTGFGSDIGKNHFAFTFRFENADMAKRAYFQPKLTGLKKQVEALTIEDVVKSAPALDFILDNEYGDLITFAESYYSNFLKCTGQAEIDMSVDEFIRHMESGVTYYVYERVIFMH